MDEMLVLLLTNFLISRIFKRIRTWKVNLINDDDFSSQIKLIKENYAEDIKYYYLLLQLEIFKVLMKDKQIESFFSDILQ